MRILLTTTSFQDTPGEHHALLADTGWEIVRARGPLPEEALLDLLRFHGGFDGAIHGDDRFTARVIDAALAASTPLRALSKFGIGVDNVDLAHATARRLPVLFCPGLSHTTVAEHAMGLMLALTRSLWPIVRSTKSGGWTRITGHELLGKTLAAIGVGRIGKELIQRASAFDMRIVGCDPCWDADFAAAHRVQRAGMVQQAIVDADIVSLHMNLDATNRGLFNADLIGHMKRGAYLINTARGGLVVEADVASACRSGHLGGYAADVLDNEPPSPGHPFAGIDNIIVTSHVASRTYESAQRLAVRAARNLINCLSGNNDYVQANPF